MAKTPSAPTPPAAAENETSPPPDGSLSRLREPVPLPVAAGADALIPLFAPTFTIEALKQEAIDVARQLVDDFPAWPQPLVLVGEAYLNQGESAEARKWLQRALERDPDGAAAWDGLGRVAFERGEYEEAVDAWQKALRCDPRRLHVLSGLAQAETILGHTEDAVRLYRQHLQHFPRASQSHLLLAQQYFQLQDYKQAEAHYQAALTIRPDYVNAYYGLAQTYVRLGKAGQSRRAMEQFRRLKAEEMAALKQRDESFDDRMSLRQSVARSHTSVGRFYQSHSHWAAAEALFQRAARLAPERSWGPRSLAEVYLRMKGKLTEAKRAAQTAVQREPTAANYFLLGQVCQRSGDQQGALAALQAAIQLEPENAQLRKFHQALMERK